jgi:hypothetical protein
MNGCLDKKVRFQQFARAANLLIGANQGGKRWIMSRVSEKICSVLKRPQRQIELFDNEA